MNQISSWGRYPKISDQRAVALSWTLPGVLESIFAESIRAQTIRVQTQPSILAYGQGRSYGDSCLNQGGSLLLTNSINRLISFDREQGILRAESGITLAQILEVIVPQGWFLPVSPGTKFVSLGGAIANDIHGKNHHRAGTFGRHVRNFELLRSDGVRYFCSPSENVELFRATIGGLGLTGLIVNAEIQLKKIDNALIDMQSIKFSHIDEFFEISASSDTNYEYTVAWVDCLATGAQFGRGIFMRGNHAKGPMAGPHVAGKELLSVPLDAPAFALNRYTIKAFNTLYYEKQRTQTLNTTVHYNPFFYPLDSIGKWNRIYGKRGLVQFQCVVPGQNGQRAIREILNTITTSQRASFLAVLKEFGDLQSPGLMSFPRKGVTLCLDFPYDGKATDELMLRLDCQVRESGGAMYPAKDAFMSPESFSAYFPNVLEFERFKDPQFSSSFWRRVRPESAIQK